MRLFKAAGSPSRSCTDAGERAPVRLCALVGKSGEIQRATVCRRSSLRTNRALGWQIPSAWLHGADCPGDLLALRHGVNRVESAAPWGPCTKPAVFSTIAVAWEHHLHHERQGWRDTGRVAASTTRALDREQAIGNTVSRTRDQGHRINVRHERSRTHHWLCQPGLPEGAGRLRTHPDPAARRGLRDRRRATTSADLVVVNTCGFIDAAVDESLDAIGEALAENGKVIVTGCLGVRESEIREAASRGACGHRPAATTRRSCAAVHAHLPTPHDPFIEPGPAAGHQADAETLRLPEDLRRLQPPLQLLHHSEHARRPGQSADRRGAGRSGAPGRGRRRANCWSSRRTPAPTVSTSDTAPISGTAGRSRPACGSCAQRARRAARPGCGCTMSTPIRMSTTSLPLMAEGLILPYLDVPLQHGSPAHPASA